MPNPAAPTGGLISMQSADASHGTSGKERRDNFHNTDTYKTKMSSNEKKEVDEATDDATIDSLIDKFTKKYANQSDSAPTVNNDPSKR
jgi:hypothetical protein